MAPDGLRTATRGHRAAPGGRRRVAADGHRAYTNGTEQTGAKPEGISNTPEEAGSTQGLLRLRETTGISGVRPRAASL